MLNRLFSSLGLSPQVSNGKVNCIIIGAAKSGTTSLFKYLSDHPELSIGKVKEIHYFDWNYDKGEAWYERHFKTKRKYRIEATPYYLFHPTVPARVHTYNPDCKFIVLLRNPMDRAISHYYHNIRIKTMNLPEELTKFVLVSEELPIAEAFRKEEERLQGTLRMMEENAANPAYNNSAFQHFSYLTRGKYAEQLRRWYKHFPRENFLILDFDELSTNPERCLVKVYDFLGIRKKFPKQYKPENQGSYDGKPELVQLKEEWSGYFDASDKELSELTNMKFTWMK